MTTKPKRPAPAVTNPRKVIPCVCASLNDPDAVGQAFAKVVTGSAVGAYRVIQAANPENIRDEIDIPGMLALLEQQAAAVNRGDLSQAEAMLMNQATALQSMFVRLAETGLTASMLPQQEMAMRLALKAQSQCRATLETLSAIKNPPVIYARQVNQTTGPQQINNGTPTPARETETEQPQLSGAIHELLPDTRASGNASRVNPALETVGKVDRAKVARG